MKKVDEFRSHSDGVSCIEFSNKKLFTGSFDHSIKFFDIKEIRSRIVERAIMSAEDVESRRLNYVWNKSKKKRKRKKKKKKRR